MCWCCSKYPKSMAQVPQISIKRVTRQKNRIVSNHCCTYGSPFTPRFPAPLAKCLYCVSLVCIYSAKLLYYSPAVYKDLPSGGGRHRHYHHGLFKASKQAKIKKKKKAQFSWFITSYQHGSISNILYLHFLTLL